MPRQSIASGTAEKPASRPTPALLRDGFPLVLLGAGLFYTNRWFSFIDDETVLLNASAEPVRTILAEFRSRGDWLAHPPLYDLLLHAWLRLSGGAFAWLRAPSILFFLLGIFLLSRAARSAGGQRSGTALLWLGALWPYGFHYGRLAAAYSFLFLLTSALTWAYLRYCASHDFAAWLTVCLLAVALIYTTYLGWGVLLFLGVDQWLRTRGQGRFARRTIGIAAVLVVAYVPLWLAFIREASLRVNFHQPWRFLILHAGYEIYALLVSESVAPWIWKFGVPATLAVAACLSLVALKSRPEARRFLVFGALLIVGMAVLGILRTNEMMLVAPWFLLPIAVEVAAMEGAFVSRALLFSLAIVGGIGWFGIVTRSHYSTARFVDPWPNLAAEATGAVENGAAVIGNDPTFFFYLTYALGPSVSGPSWRFQGSLPKAVHFPHVWSAGDWVAAGHPLPPQLLLVRGTELNDDTRPMEEATQWLDHHCGDRTERFLAHDPSYIWKARFLPQFQGDPWRVDVRQYTCEENPATPTPVPPSAGKPAAPPRP